MFNLLFLMKFRILMLAASIRTIESLPDLRLPGRIINGIATTPNQFPFWVGIICKRTRPIGFCGGSIITKQFVLTAAHCTRGLEILCNESKFKNLFFFLISAISANVYVGSNSRKGGAQFVIRANNIFTHPEFRGDPAQNDIALIKIPKLKFSGKNSRKKTYKKNSYFCRNHQCCPITDWFPFRIR